MDGWKTASDYFSLIFWSQKKNSTPDPPARKSGSWNVKGGTSCSQREFRSPVVWSRCFCNKSFFLKKLIRKHPWCNKNGAQPTQKIVKPPWELWIIYSSNLAGCVIWRSLLKRSDFHPTLVPLRTWTWTWSFRRIFAQLWPWSWERVSIFREVRSPGKHADIQNEAIFQISVQQKTRPKTGPGKASE